MNFWVKPQNILESSWNDLQTRVGPLSNQPQPITLCALQAFERHLTDTWAALCTWVQQNKQSTRNAGEWDPAHLSLELFQKCHQSMTAISPARSSNFIFAESNWIQIMYFPDSRAHHLSSPRSPMHNVASSNADRPLLQCFKPCAGNVDLTQKIKKFKRNHSARRQICRSWSRGKHCAILFLAIQNTSEHHRPSFKLSQPDLPVQTQKSADIRSGMHTSSANSSAQTEFACLGKTHA